MFPDVGADYPPEATGLEKDANGHLLIGPRMARPALAQLIASALGTLADTDTDTLRDAERLRIARAAIEEFAADVDAAWEFVKSITTKRQRNELHLRREDLFEARGWWLARQAVAA